MLKESVRGVLARELRTLKREVEAYPDDLSLCGQSFNVCFYTVCSGQGPQLEHCCRYTINCGM